MSKQTNTREAVEAERRAKQAQTQTGNKKNSMAQLVAPYEKRDAAKKQQAETRAKLASVKREILAAKGREKQAQYHGNRHDRNSRLLSTIDKSLPTHNTQTALAKELGWSTGKLAMADDLEEYLTTLTH